ncbi:PREDICTED: uncharacterized protein LOC106751892 [Dinoponera quadriceps]|uniref:Uncharacterized protein LOC106751892 n=1 Tax=Dinoponera quadriceps TaxID=609295 RepID=A0A6P3YFG6_DINQU|nr:PREDICTED: uncharacterized protein LOC106751892 [Dinoponera quadriceps]
MRTTAVCIAFVVTCTSGSFVSAIRYMDPQLGSNGDIGDKRMDLIEPSCDELRAMWRYTKRQSRAAKGNVYPLYGGPSGIFKMRSKADRTKAGTIYRGKYPGQARSRAAGGAPIYGKMVHKAPAGSRLRNGMRQRPRTLEDMRLFGTLNRYIPSNRHQRVTSFRVGGGVSSPKVPQAGSFEALKNLVQAERARELREQHIEEIIAETALKEKAEEEEEEEPIQQSRGHFSNPMSSLQIPKEYYDYNNRRYMSNIPNNGQAWSRNWRRGQYAGR